MFFFIIIVEILETLILKADRNRYVRGTIFFPLIGFVLQRGLFLIRIPSNPKDTQRFCCGSNTEGAG